LESWTGGRGGVYGGNVRTVATVVLARSRTLFRGERSFVETGSQVSVGLVTVDGFDASDAWLTGTRLVRQNEPPHVGCYEINGEGD